MCLSEPQTAVAITLMRTSAWPGRGTGTSRMSVASRPAPGLVLTTAVIRDGSREPWAVSREPGCASGRREADRAGVESACPVLLVFVFLLLFTAYGLRL